jgi:hypothetical protein
MDIQFDTGLSNKPLAFFAEKISASLSKYEASVNNLVIHLADGNVNERGRNEKICVLEARPLSADPVVVTYKATTKEQAVNGAIIKLKLALEKESLCLNNS